MLRAVIGEDSKSERMLLRKLLGRIPGLMVEGEAENGIELINLVQLSSPHIVFIDIGMPLMNGIDAAREIMKINPRTFIIIATSEKTYAKAAYEVSAFYYMVKPYNFNELTNTIQRIRIITEGYTKSSHCSVHKVEQHTHGSCSLPKKLIIQHEDGLIFVRTTDIVMITKSERKTEIYTTNGVYKVNEALDKIESRLGRNFFRSHKGYIINIDMIREVMPWGNKTYILRFNHLKETALMTQENFKLFKSMYCVE